jgi:nitrogenase molybdenum-iron protein alpha/beta subunit
MPKISIDYDLKGIPRKTTEDLKIKIIHLLHHGGRDLHISGYSKNEISFVIDFSKIFSISVEDTEFKDVIQFKSKG